MSKNKVKNDAGILKMLNRRAEIRDFRQADAQCRREFWNGAVRYDNPLKDENGDEQEDRSLSDRGRGAAFIRSLGDDPEWLVEFNHVVDSLKGTEKKVVDALFVDMRLAVAARIARVSRPTVYKVLKTMRERLATARALYTNR